MSISEKLKIRVRDKFNNRCAYCHSSQKYVLSWLEIEHIIPTASGGSDDEANLCLACRFCNGYKGAQTHGLDSASKEQIALYNPRTQSWHEHFKWGENGTEIVGLTPCGRATVLALQMNNPIAVMVREQWISAGWHPPAEDVLDATNND